LIERLEFILALARERHFGRAAQFCNVSQQTLSAGVKQLEERLGVMLVQRGSRFQGFTPEGERVLEWARRIVGDARAMRQEVASLRRGLSGMLRLAAIPTATPVVAFADNTVPDASPRRLFLRAIHHVERHRAPDRRPRD